MAREDNLSESLSDYHWLDIWKVAVDHIPLPLRIVIGFFMFVIQANLSNILIRYQDAILSNPLYIFLTFIIILFIASILFLNKVRKGQEDLIREISKNNQNLDKKQDDTKMLHLQELQEKLHMMDAKISEIEGHDRKNQNIATESAEEITEEINSMHKKISEMEKELEELRKESISSFEFDEKIREIKSNVELNEEKANKLYNLMEYNIEGFVPPSEIDLSDEKIQSNSEQSSEVRDASETETEQEMEK